MSTGYYRFPTLHQENIVFVSEDDLWSVSAAGGVARRLTSNRGETSYPALSPDGRQLTFIGREEGATEVYLMPAQGGPIRRLTFMGSRCRVLGWTPDGREIVFSSNFGQPFSREFALFSIAADGLNDTGTPLPYGPARAIAFGAHGEVVLGCFTGEPANWKRYRGGTAGQLWIDRSGNGQFERFLAGMQGNIASPMWLETPHGARVFFVSDHEGVGNLYSCRPDGEDVRRHTDHEEFYVRNPSTDGRRIVYHAGADLWLFDPANDSNRLIEVELRSPRIQRNRRFVDAGRYLDSARLHPSGRALAVATRGKAFAFFNHDGPVLQYGGRNGARYRLPEWLYDGRRLVVISDEPGEECIEVYGDEQDRPLQRIEGLDIGRVVLLRASPTEDKVAVANHRHELLVVNVSQNFTGEVAGRVTVVDRSPYRPIAGFDWSPDGRWLAYGCSLTPQTTAIRLCHLTPPADSQPDSPRQYDEDAPPRPATFGQPALYTITQPVLHDVRPSFDPDGNYLYFLSYREFNPVYDSLHFDLGFPWGMRPYLVTLRADLLNPFTAHPETEEEDGAPANGNGKKGDKDDDDDDDQENEDDSEAADDEGDEYDAEEDGEGDDEYDDGEDDEQEEEDRVPLWLEGRASRQVRRSAAKRNLRGEGFGWLTGRLYDAASEGQETGRAVEMGSEKANAKRRPADQEGKEKAGKSRRLRIDLEGIERRIAPFPTPDARYGQVIGIPGKVLFTSFEAHGALDDLEHAEDDERRDLGALRSHNFKELKTETVAESVSWFDVSLNRKKVLYASGRRLRVIAAGEKAPSENGHPRKTGWIDLHRVKVSVEPAREWEQMFREAWRLQRDHFWAEDMSQVDWQAVYLRYLPLMERVSSRSEFSDLMWEMQGELGTSHAYEYGGDYRPQPHYGQGFLGATLAWEADVDGYRIQQIVAGDPWDAAANSPLCAPGVDVRAGDLLTAINGQRLDSTFGPAQALVNLAGQEVLLTLAPRPAQPQSANGHGEDSHPAGSLENGRATSSDARGSTEPIHVVVRTLASETPARYRAWVTEKRRRVHDASNNRVGYVHIPDMGPTGYAEFHRGYLAELERDALIIDVRYNSGGHVSQLILEKLARRRVGYEVARWGGTLPYPVESVAGPLVALTNELTGSDGDIFCHTFKLMKLGPLVGKRTWGGVVGISPRHTLVDGTVTTQPEYSFWFEDIGWNMENFGAEPDIEVDITPQEHAAGQDPQLERAISEALALLEQKPPLKPDLGNRPSRALPKLPPRG